MTRHRANILNSVGTATSHSGKVCSAVNTVTATTCLAVTLLAEKSARGPRGVLAWVGMALHGISVNMFRMATTCAWLRKRACFLPVPADPRADSDRRFCGTAEVLR